MSSGIQCKIYARRGSDCEAQGAGTRTSQGRPHAGSMTLGDHATLQNGRAVLKPAKGARLLAFLVSSARNIATRNGGGHVDQVANDIEPPRGLSRVTQNKAEADTNHANGAGIQQR